MKLLFAAIAVLLALPAQAGLYKCTKGTVVSYQATPCQDGKETEIKEPKRYHDEAEQGEKISESLSIGPIYIKDEGISFDWQDFSAKVTVKNNTELEQKVYLTYKGIDKDGFQVDSVTLSGTIPPKQTRTLTTQSNSKIADYKRVRKWELDR